MGGSFSLHGALTYLLGTHWIFIVLGFELGLEVSLKVCFFSVSIRDLEKSQVLARWNHPGLVRSEGPRWGVGCQHSPLLALVMKPWAATSICPTVKWEHGESNEIMVSTGRQPLSCPLLIYEFGVACYFCIEFFIFLFYSDKSWHVAGRGQFPWSPPWPLFLHGVISIVEVLFWHFIPSFYITHSYSSYWTFPWRLVSAS